MTALVSLITRIFRGERLEQAADEDCRYWLSYFFFVPVLLILGITCGSTFLQRAPAVVLWFVVMLVIAAGWFGYRLWRKRVPTKVSLILGIVAWLILLGVALIWKL